MFPEGLFPILIQIIISWQVIAVTIAMVLFLFLVNYVAQTYHRPRSVSKVKPQKAKIEKKPKKAKKSEASVEDNSNEALGLDE